MNPRIEQLVKACFRYSLLLIAFFIPAHMRVTGALIGIAFISFLIFNRFKITFTDKKRLYVFIALTALYGSYAIGMIYTANTSQGWQHMMLRSSMILFPLIFLSDSKVEMPSWNELMKWFIAGGVFISIVLIGHACFIWFTEHRNIFFYGYLTEFLRIHSSYLSLYFDFIVITLAWELLQFSQKPKRKIFLLILIAFFVLMLALLAAREQIIALVITGLFLFIIYFLARKSLMIAVAFSAGIMALLGAFFLLIPFTQERFIDVLNQLNEPYSNQHPTSFNERKVVWQTCGELIARHAFLGVGTGDSEDSLLASYAKKDLEWPLNDKLNAHNQFLQTTVSNGLIGLAALIFLLVVSFQIAIVSGNRMHLFFLMLFFISILTESMFEMEAGVVFFSFFNSWFFGAFLNRREQRIL